MTQENLDIAKEILHYRDCALLRRDNFIESANGYGGQEFPRLKEKWLHKAEISQMAADHFTKRFETFMFKNL